MNKFFTFLLIFFCSSSLFSQNNKFVQAQLFHSKFYSPSEGSYLETYLSVVGSSVTYNLLDNGKYQGKVEVAMIFTKDSVVVNYDKYELLSPEIDDTTNVTLNFLDQQRFALPNGVYDFEIRIKDMSSTNPPFDAIQTIVIDFPKDEVAVSGIQLVESYSETTSPNVLSKSGYDLVPYVYNYLPRDVNSLIFYAEIYNTDKAFGADEQFLVNYYLETYESGKKLNKFTSFKRESAKPVTILFANFNVEELPSGNYKLFVEVRNRNNEVVTNNMLFFQRNNPGVSADYTDFVGVDAKSTFASKITSRDTLRQFIDFIGPISTDMELNFVKYQIDKGDIDLQTMQRFFFNFWLERDDLNPEYAWKQYLSNVELVNDQFGAPGNKGKRGYDTDMGRVYLKYGPPNTIMDRPFDASTSGMAITDGGGAQMDAGSVPYQIWHYYTLDALQLRNRKFVFANIHIALNDYKLIHSNVPGEISNENWQAELLWRFQQGVTMPDNDKYGGQSGDFYNNPR